jgi:hypothetical protein
MFWAEEDAAIRQLVRETALENANVNIICMEALLTNATKSANLKRDKCALVTQQVNYDVIEMSIAEEKAKNRFAQDSDNFLSNPLNFETEEHHGRQQDPITYRPTFSPPVRTHNKQSSRTGNTWASRRFG